MMTKTYNLTPLILLISYSAYQVNAFLKIKVNLNKNFNDKLYTNNTIKIKIKIEKDTGQWSC